MGVQFKSYEKQVLSAEKSAKSRVLNRLGMVAEGYAVKLSPVDTGRLRNSITHKQLDDNTEVIGTNVDYAPYVELGHHTRSGGWVRPKEFLRPAVENHKEEFRQIIRNEFQK